MIVKFLDKFGKLVKSITSIGYLPVEVEPVKDSKHLLSSGAVANIGSSIAPNYTKTTYPANSYVMQGGVLYTNENAIGTAEDWNPAHWTQTTVAEMINNAGRYKQVNLTFGQNDPKTIPVGQKEEVYAQCWIKNSDDVVIQLADDCTDAVLELNRTNASAPHSFKVKKGTTEIGYYGGQIVTGIFASQYIDSNKVMLTTNTEEGEHGSVVPVPPASFSEIELANDYALIDSVTAYKTIDKISGVGSGRWLFVVKGDYVVCLPT